MAKKQVENPEKVEKETSGKRIEVVEMKVSQLKNNFENPRKVRKGELLKLRKSFEEMGDYGVFVIDEKDNIISGNQRASQLMELDPETPILCKRLIGYSEMELKKINIDANTHAGEWDMNILSRWLADMGVEADLKPKGSIEDRKIDNMELVRFEKYNYMIIAFKTEMEFSLMEEKLGLKGKKVIVNDSNQRKLKARAVWFDKLAQLLK
ncbi:MAG: hypothetical protein KC589_09345 [Nanoarchaeota archaeon]|nr:hypothetical protein [Nanoarchaeota archaeon]